MKIVEFYQDPERLYIVGEYYSGGDLFEKMSSIQVFTEKQAAVIMKQILSAINFCHKNKIVHRYSRYTSFYTARDIKPENIVYEGPEANTLKLIDFGTSTEFQPNVTLSKALGTVSYNF
jgi:calcium-dependent protein kinase